ncbi:Putative RNaseIII [Heterostelium album PN500]|uniref:tRNA (guanine(9)-N(1))-methyltransferase n=1 Tax=Heterostelium pallidum (strain ATCC 26659 / Pp 5 / PN500) TaxID=670386 RepID=D3BLD3_HETP5|nr:Putative RNaseIII [Heterostelium album PN500]EFA77867.1 Putative RNaseIII [Heterostelium album PN500]|eukprot:XP_020429995.1 Putative RNaseIII [Heterostelium album PN500]
MSETVNTTTTSTTSTNSTVDVEKVELQNDNSNNENNIDTTNNNNNADEEQKPLSKGQMKRKIKEERWNQVKDQRKEYLKQKKKEIKKRKHQEMSREQKLEKKLKKQKKQRDPSTIEYSGNVVLDMEMSDLMNEKEMRSTVNQVCYLYGANTKSEHPLKIAITGYKGKIRDMMEAMNGVPNWKSVSKHEQTYMDLFNNQVDDDVTKVVNENENNNNNNNDNNDNENNDNNNNNNNNNNSVKKLSKDQLVYLTAESPNILQKIDPTKHYIIGSFVDHNKLKGYTYKKATEQGIATAQLPIAEYIQLSSRKVLAINHVFEILLQFAHNNDWKESFEKVIPSRKQTKDEDEDEYIQSELNNKNNNNNNNNEKQQEEDVATTSTTSTASTTSTTSTTTTQQIEETTTKQ